MAKATHPIRSVDPWLKQGARRIGGALLTFVTGFVLAFSVVMLVCWLATMTS